MTGTSPAQGRLISLARPDSSLVTALLVVVAVLLLLFLLLRHVVRKRGGWRRFRRGVAREVTLTRRAFGEPLRAYRRHRRGVRALARHLCDPRSGLLVRRLLDGAGAALGDVPGAFAYGLRTEPGRAAVQIAARRLPAPPAPWGAADDVGPQSWWLGLDDEDALPDAAPRAGARVRPLPVVVGTADDSCVHLDLAAGPRMITVEGDTVTRTRLLQALAAQLDRPGSGASVTVTEGVHPHHPGDPLDTVLRRLEDPDTAATDEEAVATATVVVCASPTRDQARRLGELAANGTVICLTDGPAAGPSWALRVDGRGRVTAPELDLYADSAPLNRAVAAAVRADRRRARRAPERRQRPLDPAVEPRTVPERRAPAPARQTELTEPSELVEETPPLAPVRTVAGADLLSEPATARSRPAEASSTGGD